VSPLNPKPCLADELVVWLQGSKLLRVDNNARIVRLGWSLSALFTGRYAVQLGRRVASVRWKAREIEAIRAEQASMPVALLLQGRRRLWHFHERFFWDSDDLSPEDVRALLLQRERKLQQQIRSAHSVMRAEEAGRPTRVPIPTELRRAVFERDGGQCVQCEGRFDLQYDHILPVARGGATTIENLQLLCADCNRRKSDSL
jgi:5-methylcytosine-specific restriction endonuclease McrA